MDVSCKTFVAAPSLSAGRPFRVSQFESRVPARDWVGLAYILILHILHWCCFNDGNEGFNAFRKYRLAAVQNCMCFLVWPLK